MKRFNSVTEPSVVLTLLNSNYPLRSPFRRVLVFDLKRARLLQLLRTVLLMQRGLALALVSIATLKASISLSGHRLRFGATAPIPFSFACQSKLYCFRYEAEQTVN